jgi:hypothetical protein
MYSTDYARLLSLISDTHLCGAPLVLDICVAHHLMCAIIMERIPYLTLLKSASPFDSIFFTNLTSFETIPWYIIATNSIW